MAIVNTLKPLIKSEVKNVGAGFTPAHQKEFLATKEDLANLGLMFKKSC